MRTIFRRILFPLIMAVIAVVLVVFGFITRSRQHNWVKAEAVITYLDYTPGVGDDDSADWTVLVSYSVHGTHYEAELDQYSSTYHLGDTVELRYNPDSPGEVTADTPALPYLLIAGGFVLLIGAVIVFLRGA